MNDSTFTPENSIVLPDGCRVMRDRLAPCACCDEPMFEVVSITRLIRDRVTFLDEWGPPNISVQCPNCLALQRWERNRQRRMILGTLDMRSGELIIYPKPREPEL